jgi:hypothetical protein
MQEQLGQREEARRTYAEFIEVWQDADVEFQPIVEDARRRLAALVAERGRSRSPGTGSRTRSPPLSRLYRPLLRSARLPPRPSICNIDVARLANPCYLMQHERCITWPGRLPAGTIKEAIMVDVSNEVLAGAFGTNDYLLNRALVGFDEEAVRRRLGETANSVSWIVGHIAYWKQEILTLLGGPEVWPPSDRAGYRGVTRDGPVSDETPWGELVRLVGTLQREITPRLAEASLSDAALRKSLWELASHEGYHVGQIGIGRRLLGMEPTL